MSPKPKGRGRGRGGVVTEAEAESEAGAGSSPGPSTGTGTESKRDRLLRRAGWVVLAVAALVYTYRLGDPPSSYRAVGAPPVYVHDECYQAFTANRYVRGDRSAWDPRAGREKAELFDKRDMTENTTYEWIHPPLAKLVMAAGIGMFGFEPFAYRIGGVLMALLAMFAVWRLGLRMAGPAYALLALGILAVDGMVFSMARVAMNDIYVTGFSACVLLVVYRFWTDDKHRARWLYAVGALLGLALASKWNAMPLWLGVIVLSAGKIGWDARQRVLRGKALAFHGVAWVVGLLALPLAVYMMSFIPYFANGYSWHDFVVLNKEIIHYNRTLRATHSRSSVWYTWPLVTRPVWMFLHNQGDTSRVIYAMGSPALWWLFLPALAWTAVRWVRERLPADGVILVGFCAFWLPWAFIGRVTFMQYLLPAVPFGALAVARLVTDAATALGKRGRWVPLGYAGVCVALFVWFYPIWTGLPVAKSALAGSRWFWFASWR